MTKFIQRLMLVLSFCALMPQAFMPISSTPYSYSCDKRISSLFASLEHETLNNLKKLQQYHNLSSHATITLQRLFEGCDTCCDKFGKHALEDQEIASLTNSILAIIDNNDLRDVLVEKELKDLKAEILMSINRHQQEYEDAYMEQMKKDWENMNPFNIFDF